MIHHPTHGFLPWAADRAQATGLFHVAALIRSAMDRIDELTEDRDRLREALSDLTKCHEALTTHVGHDAENAVCLVKARAALKEQSK